MDLKGLQCRKADLRPRSGAHHHCSGTGDGFTPRGRRLRGHQTKLHALDTTIDAAQRWRDEQRIAPAELVAALRRRISHFHLHPTRRPLGARSRSALSANNCWPSAAATGRGHGLMQIKAAPRRWRGDPADGGYLVQQDFTSAIELGMMTVGRLQPHTPYRSPATASGSMSSRRPTAAGSRWGAVTATG